MASAERRIRLPLWQGLVFASLLSLVAAGSAAEDNAAGGDTAAPRHGHRTLSDNRFQFPSREELARVLLLRDYNTRVVAGGTLLLGISAGVVGVFMLLRRRSLVGDVISHAALPGIAIAFLAIEFAAPGSGKSLPALLMGALISGLLGIVCTTLILRYSRIKEDAALAIVLSVFFGFGVALMTVIQNVPTGNSAGLHQFIFGKAASMVLSDIHWITGAAIAVMVVFGLLFKEFAILSFDEPFAGAQGWPTTALDLTLMTLVTVVTVIALQSVGMLLAVAMLVTPAAAARFWTNDLRKLTLLAAVIGGAAALLGVLCSALFPKLAAGAVIVLAGSTLFTLSLVFGAKRGIAVRIARQRKVYLRVGRDHLLRAFFEHIEEQLDVRSKLETRLPATPVHANDLLPARSWTTSELAGWLRRAVRDGLVVREEAGSFRLTEQGVKAARRVVRNHRLWELYLIEHADIAPSHVDRDADDIEHSIGPEVVAQLESLLVGRSLEIPESPH